LVGQKDNQATGSPPLETPLDLALSLDAETLLVAYSSRQRQRPTPDKRAIHGEIKEWFLTLLDRIQGRPDEPIVAFEELAQTTSPPLLRAAIAEEVARFHAEEVPFDQGC
jgi:hypothetical protein